MRQRGRAKLVVLVLVAGVAGVIGYAKWNKARNERWLDEHQAEFAAEGKKLEEAEAARVAPYQEAAKTLFPLATASPERLDAESGLPGKLVVLRLDDPDRGGVDPLTFDVKPDRKAVKSDEVTTVVLISRGKDTIGHYDKTGATAYRLTCDVSLYDAARKVVFAKKHFAGGDPPRSKSAGSYMSEYGSDPSSDVLKWIDELPLR